MLCIALAIFQRWFNRTLQHFSDHCCIVYLDDVLIYSDKLEQHQADVRNIINSIYQSRMRLKPSKFKLLETEKEYLGFIVSHQGIKVDPVKTKAIRIWGKSSRRKQIDIFRGFCNFYPRFIKVFSKIAESLYKLTEKDKK